MSLLYHNIITIITMIIIIIRGGASRLQQAQDPRYLPWKILDFKPNADKLADLTRSFPVWSLLGSLSRRLRSTAHTGSCVLVQDGIVHSGGAPGAAGVGSKTCLRVGSFWLLMTSQRSSPPRPPMKRHHPPPAAPQRHRSFTLPGKKNKLFLLLKTQKHFALIQRFPGCSQGPFFDTICHCLVFIFLFLLS